MKLFGDKDSFAIQYRANPNRISDKNGFAFCHLIFGNKLIGSPDEICMVGGWAYRFEVRVNRIHKNQGKLHHALFSKLTDREIFELIYKSNQIESNFNSEFDYLPQLPDNELWRKHTFDIDETVDGYSIIVIEESQKLKFIWMSEGWYEPEEKGKLFTVVVEPEMFFKVAEECLAFLASTYPNIVKRTKDN